MKVVQGDIDARLVAYRALKGQTLILVPEVVDVEWLSKKISGAAPYHAGLNTGVAWKNWTAFARGRARVLIATRIGALAPAKRLKTIVVERDEDPSHKNTDALPRYDARLIARDRAANEEVELVIGTEIPRVTRIVENPALLDKLSFYRPTIVDQRDERRARNPSIISEKLRAALTVALAQNKKAVLILNRKGLAAVSFCRGCRHVFSCTECAAPLTLYRHSFVCPSCRKLFPVPLFCPACKGPELIHAKAGLERVRADLHKMFPEVEIEMVFKMKESDRPGPYPHRPRIMVATEAALHWYRYDLYDDADIGLVSVLLADQLWGRPGYASEERALRILGSLGFVARRHGAEFVVQTYNPDAPVIRALTASPQKFYEDELDDRRRLGYPPFGNLVVLRPPRARGTKGEAPRAVKVQSLSRLTVPAGWSVDIDPEIIPEDVSF